MKLKRIKQLHQAVEEGTPTKRPVTGRRVTKCPVTKRPFTRRPVTKRPDYKTS